MICLFLLFSSLAPLKYKSHVHSLLNVYKQGGDKALTEACNFDKEKKERFYHSLPEGRQLYERLNQARLEGKDTSSIEKEIKIRIDKTLNPPALSNPRAQTDTIARSIPDTRETDQIHKNR